MIHYSRVLTTSAILLLSSNAFAYYNEESFPEINIMGGISSIDMEDTSLVINATDVDLLTQTSEDTWQAFTVEAGFGWVYFITNQLKTGAVQWFPYVTPKINVYYLDSSDLKGHVYQDEYYNEHTLDYTMDFESVRAMFDVELTLAKINWFSVYGIGGIGVAWNKLQLNTKPTQLGLELDAKNYELESKNSSGFAYEFGAGITADLRNDLAISLEYLYSGLTNVELGNSPADSDFNIYGSSLDINNQSILLGLRFAIK
ncbi:MAG: outer membrane beta-barrel protein [Gammaproteobacteria bacterium]|jgi:opacity protein-like surface antigen